MSAGGIGFGKGPRSLLVDACCLLFDGIYQGRSDGAACCFSSREVEMRSQ